MQSASQNKNEPLKRGETGRAVEILQQCLIDAGLPLPNSTRRSGQADGAFGPETESAVKTFQAANSLKPDGLVGPLTLERLDGFCAMRDEAEAVRLHAELSAPPPICRWYIS